MFKDGKFAKGLASYADILWARHAVYEATKRQASVVFHGVLLSCMWFLFVVIVSCTLKTEHNFLPFCQNLCYSEWCDIL